MIKYIQVFGLQCSGTNILQRLCAANFDIEVGSKHGSKHGVNLRFLRERDWSDTLFLHIHKNIWAWICSMTGQTHGVIRSGLSVTRAMREPWGVEGFDFSDMIAMRNHVLETFRTIESIVPNWVNIQHDDMMGHPREILRSIVEMYGVPLTSGGICIDIAKHYKGRTSNGMFERKKHYYETKAYMKELSEEDIKHIDEVYSMECEEWKWLKLPKGQ